MIVGITHDLRSEWLAMGYSELETPGDVGEVRLGYPVFAKPLAEGTGKGITPRSRIDDPADLARACRSLLVEYSQPVLAEEYLSGR